MSSDSYLAPTAWLQVLLSDPIQVKVSRDNMSHALPLLTRSFIILILPMFAATIRASELKEQVPLKSSSLKMTGSQNWGFCFGDILASIERACLLILEYEAPSLDLPSIVLMTIAGCFVMVLRFLLTSLFILLIFNYLFDRVFPKQEAFQVIPVDEIFYLLFELHVIFSVMAIIAMDVAV